MILTTQFISITPNTFLFIYHDIIYEGINTDIMSKREGVSIFLSQKCIFVQSRNNDSIRFVSLTLQILQGEII